MGLLGFAERWESPETLLYKAESSEDRVVKNPHGVFLESSIGFANPMELSKKTPCGFLTTLSSDDSALYSNVSGDSQRSANPKRPTQLRASDMIVLNSAPMPLRRPI